MLKNIDRGALFQIVVFFYNFFFAAFPTNISALIWFTACWCEAVTIAWPVKLKLEL